MMHNYGNQFQLGTSARDTRAFFFGYEEIITMQIKKKTSHALHKTGPDGAVVVSSV